MNLDCPDAIVATTQQLRLHALGETKAHHASIVTGKKDGVKRLEYEAARRAGKEGCQLRQRECA